MAQAMKPYEIKSHCAVKRAFEVASVGDLGVLLVGPLGTGKTTLRDAFPTVRSAERETCPCGHWRDVTRECTCSTRTIERWYRRLERTARDYDIVLETCAVPARELMSQRDPDPKEQEYMDARIAAARAFGATHQSVELRDDATIRMIEMALRRLSLTAGQYNAVLRTARAIANLDASEHLKAKHVAEGCPVSRRCPAMSPGRKHSPGRRF